MVSYARFPAAVGGLLVTALLVLLLAAPSADGRRVRAAKLRPVGTPALSDAAAAARVRRRPEVRPENRAANRRVPTDAELRHFHAHSRHEYHDRVTGRFRGTTNEIIQWAAHKHGLDANLLRAIAAVESWWESDAVGCDGRCLGLFQRNDKCCSHLFLASTAFNADYFASELRAYYDGVRTWVMEFAHGAPYRAGDLWGSVGATNDRWWTDQARWYIRLVKRNLRSRPWRSPEFRSR